VSAVAQSDDAPPAPGVGELTEGSDDLSMGLDVGLGYSRLDEDSFLETSLAFTLGFGDFHLGLWAPLRFRIVDEDPQDDGVIRSLDWDEPGDYMRILRFVQYGSPSDTVYVRAGELSNVSIGHGTIVAGYNNVVDLNHFQWGVHSAFNFSPGGGELLLDNLVNPDLMGLRAYVRPWHFIDPESYAYNLAFGASLIGDIDAPLTLTTLSNGEYFVDEERNFEVAEEDGTLIVGVDAELQAFTNDYVSVTPYTDVNMHIDHGTGLHIGNLTNFTFSEAVSLNTRLELRIMGEGYEPTYFDQLYEVERFLYRALDVTNQRRPKLAVLGFDPPESRIGWYGEGTLSLFSVFFLTMGYEDYQGPDNTSFFARLALPELGPVSLGAYYVNQNFDGAEEMFKLDNALVVTEARVTFFAPFYAIAQFSRRFSANADGTYEPVDDWGVGVGASFSF